MYTGKDIIALGIEPGDHIRGMIDRCNQRGCCSIETIMDLIPAPKLILDNLDKTEVFYNISPTNDVEQDNFTSVYCTMEEVVRTPTIIKGAVMPDACPAGPVGTIPVGGVAVAENAIHPGMHSADICCSMMVTNTGIKCWHNKSDSNEVGPGYITAVLDACESVTHFGPGGRKNGQRYTLSPRIYESMLNNSFLNSTKTLQMAHEHLGTQGDGNHFFYVGVLESTGEICLVTHHGSRGPGAQLYRAGMQIAEKMTKKIAKGVLKQNCWIRADSDEGVEYWDALQIIRRWTKANHNSLHQAVCDSLGIKHKERFWNEHNFVFTKGDGLFYHAKGATPVDTDFLPDHEGFPQIVPLNMNSPVLLIRGDQSTHGLGFAPHGAGRNMSRTKHKKLQEGTDEEIFKRETSGIDARFYSGNIDISELPSAYKSPDEVIRQMEYYRLAKVVDKIQPYGSIMSGDWEKDAHWRKKKGR